MALKSHLFSGCTRLENCAVIDSAHVQRGDRGVYVAKIQAALDAIDEAEIDGLEWRQSSFGPSTEAAVLNYKTQRQIINPAYQNKPDAIVGKMTIASLDRDMYELQLANDSSGRGSRPVCQNCSIKPMTSGGRSARLRGYDLPVMALTESATLPKATVANPSVTAPTATRPKLLVGIGYSWAVQDGAQHIMIPRGSAGRIVVDTAGSKCYLIVADNVRVTESMLKGLLKKQAMPGFTRYDLNPQSVPYEIELTGVHPDTFPILLRAVGEPFQFDAQRDVTVAVKEKLIRSVRLIFPTDARGRKSDVSPADAEKQFQFVRSFYLRWCNVELNINGVLQCQVDEDMGDQFNQNMALARLSMPDDDTTNRAIGKRSRLFQNDWEQSQYSKATLVYVMWKLVFANEGTLAATVDRRVFIQNAAGDLTGWTKILAHEIGHALGVPGRPHPDPPGFMMTEFIQGIGNRMSLTATEMVNPPKSER
jgi:hypothetical protein